VICRYGREDRHRDHTGLGSIDVGDGFTKREGAFLTEGALSGEAPVLAICLGSQVGAGTRGRPRS
jgi:hypothetical protein